MDKTPTKTIASIVVTTEFAAFHQWPDAPDSVAFLRYKHRHVFKVHLMIKVEGLDRALEFLTVKEQLVDYTRKEFEGQTFYYSCEQIAQLIFDYMDFIRKYHVLSVMVSEDGENAGMVTRAPDQTPVLKGNSELIVIDDPEADKKGEPVIPKIRKDGRCDCTAGTKCPLGKTGADVRCREEDLHAAGLACVRTNEDFDQRLFKTDPKTELKATRNDHPFLTTKKTKCFIGIEAEGIHRGELVLFVPASTDPKKFLKTCKKLHRSAFGLPFHLYIGAGNDRYCFKFRELLIEAVAGALREGWYARIAVEVGSLDDVGMKYLERFSKPWIRYVTMSPKDLDEGYGGLPNNIAVKTVQGPGGEPKTIVVTEKDGTVTETDAYDPLFNQDIDIDKRFWYLLEHLSDDGEESVTFQQLRAAKDNDKLFEETHCADDA